MTIGIVVKKFKYGLITNLVETAKDYLKHIYKTLETVIEAHNQA